VFSQVFVWFYIVWFLTNELIIFKLFGFLRTRVNKWGNKIASLIDNLPVSFTFLFLIFSFQIPGKNYNGEISCLIKVLSRMNVTSRIIIFFGITIFPWINVLILNKCLIWHESAFKDFHLFGHVIRRISCSFFEWMAVGIY